ncbi:hypothetical protein F5148DRAFT_779858 [Russula earlei]|uniref:Uncharacterized protein n=1 Tax=Russula earlei TaxID=71964 RepID=A0ACC0UDT6_9AGAM|nr:hypothetical protein F5148DRAFT_779858 [Russula earlei]
MLGRRLGLEARLLRSCKRPHMHYACGPSAHCAPSSRTCPSLRSSPPSHESYSLDSLSFIHIWIRYFLYCLLSEELGGVWKLGIVRPRCGARPHGSGSGSGSSSGVTVAIAEPQPFQGSFGAHRSRRSRGRETRHTRHLAAHLNLCAPVTLGARVRHCCRASPRHATAVGAYVMCEPRTIGTAIVVSVNELFNGPTYSYFRSTDKLPIHRPFDKATRIFGFLNRHTPHEGKGSVGERLSRTWMAQ